MNSTAGQPQQVRAREAISVRLPADLLNELQLYRALTGTTANGLVNRLLTEFFAGPGRRELIGKMTVRARERYGVALNELVDE